MKRANETTENKNQEKSIFFMSNVLLCVSMIANRLRYLIKTAPSSQEKIDRLLNVMSNLGLIANACSGNKVDVDAISLFFSLLENIEDNELSELKEILTKFLVNQNKA